MTCCSIEEESIHENIAVSVDGKQVSALQAQCDMALQGLNLFSQEDLSETVKSLHVTADGGVLHTSAMSSGNEGHVVLRGVVGPFPYEIHLWVRMEGPTIVVTIDVEKPINLDPFTYRFDLLGIVRSEGGIIGANDIKPSIDIAPMGLDWWCVAKCGGVGILGTLVKCLPSLAGGPPAYVACVTGSAGSAAAGIAICIAKDCA